MPPRPPAALPLLLALVLLAPSGTAAANASTAPPAERAEPAVLVAAAEHHRSVLSNLSTVERADEARRLLEAASPNASRVVDAVRDLDARDGPVLSNYWGSLRAEAQAGNTSNVRSLARAATNLLEDDLLPQLRAWSANGTAVTPGVARAGSDGGTRVPVLLLHPPPGGVGAFDVTLRVDPDAVRVASAEPAVGRGEATVDAANGTARVASFDAKALGNLDAGKGFVTLAWVTLEPRTSAGGSGSDGSGVPVTAHVHVEELVTPQGETVPAVTAPGAVAVGAADEGGPGIVVALAVVGVLGVGAAWAARRFLEV